MAAAVPVRQDNSPELQTPEPTRNEVLVRYRHLRAISKRHNSRAMDFMAKDTILQQARRLGLAQGKTFILDSMDDLTLAFDLAIYTAPAGRSRAIDRYARSTKFAPESDEAQVLDAMCHSRFAVVMVDRRHPAAGLIVTDRLRKTELWLVDEGLEASLPEGSMIATRYYTPDRFAMTAGICVPMNLAVFRSALASVPQLLRKSHAEAIEDRRLASGSRLPHRHCGRHDGRRRLPRQHRRRRLIYRAAKVLSCQSSQRTHDVSAEELWKLSEVELLAAYHDARRQYVEKKFARDTERARLDWLKAKAFASHSGGVTERKYVVDASEEFGRKGQQLREMTRDLELLRADVDLIAMIVRLRSTLLSAEVKIDDASEGDETERGV